MSARPKVADPNVAAFDALVKAAETLGGFSLSYSHVGLFRSRLMARVHTLGLPDLATYWKDLKAQGKDASEWQRLVGLATVHMTSFFREAHHFRYLVQEYLPKWRARHRDHFRVWCAGCSSGEEPYSLALVLAKELGDRYDIVATDVDTECLATARRGVYPRGRLGEVPDIYHHAGFAHGTGDIADWMKVRDEIRARVTFETHNLLATPYAWREHFDLVICRNVLLYFDTQAMLAALDGFAAASVPESMLFVGHSESLLEMATTWRFVEPGVYGKAPALPDRIGGDPDTTRVIALGASTGGTEALRDILSKLPKNIPPVLIVQHMPASFTESFAARLAEACPFTVRLARDGDELHPRQVLIAPGDRHMGVEVRKKRLVVRLSDDAPINHHRPSIDFLFGTLATAMGKSAIGVLLTGMGTDGASGLRQLRDAGAHTIAQDESSSVVFGMPGEAIRLGAAERVAKLDEIPATILTWLRTARRG